MFLAKSCCSKNCFVLCLTLPDFTSIILFFVIISISLEKVKLNTVSVVYDEENDKYYYGMNRGIELHHSPKNAILFGDDKHQGILPTTSFNNYPVGDCAEVDAINNALNAGAKLQHLHLTTLDVKRKNITSHNIVGKCACENCTYAFKGKVKTNNTK